MLKEIENLVKIVVEKMIVLKVMTELKDITILITEGNIEEDHIQEKAGIPTHIHLDNIREDKI